MPRSALGLLAAVPAAFVIASPLQAGSRSPWFVVDEHCAAPVSRRARQWSDAFAALPAKRRLGRERLGVGGTAAIASQSVPFAAMAPPRAVPEPGQWAPITLVLQLPPIALMSRLGLNRSGRHIPASLTGGCPWNAQSRLPANAM
jgi:hypothetical protein